MRGADLRDADLSGAALLEANLVGAKANGGTRWPADYDPEAAGVVFE
ncbi:pentapeptide repeat-containing protein [Nonomuraea dietziae]